MGCRVSANGRHGRHAAATVAAVVGTVVVAVVTEISTCPHPTLRPLHTPASNRLIKKPFTRLLCGFKVLTTQKRSIKMAAVQTLPSDVQKVANEGNVKLFGKWTAHE